MAETVSFNLRLDKDLKKQAETLFNELGMNMTTGITVYLKQAIREKSIPFKITTETECYDCAPWRGDFDKYSSYDSFVAEKLRESEQRVSDGKMKYYSEDELREMMEGILNEKV